jgi:hypothetical protein
MGDFSTIREHMEVIGADGVHLGTVDKVEGEQVRLSANAEVAATFEEEKSGEGI